ncbi:DUF4347 domain-containing protein [Thalassobellus citreus]|uniref:DUF4347 domain-containing protein n=1 Tax=Thalassobellus citreus TaxID=3367752 RepID=UPI0037A1BD4B
MKSKFHQIKFLIILLLINSGGYLFAQSQDLVVIDQSYAQKEKLLSKLPSNIAILNINDSSNPWKTIREKLESDSNLKNIHLFAESSYKSILMGGIEYTNVSLDNEFELSMLEGLYSGNNYQLLLYTCNLASNSEGLNLIKKLGNKAYFNVGASTNCIDIFNSSLTFDFTSLGTPTVNPIFTK